MAVRDHRVGNSDKVDFRVCSMSRSFERVGGGVSRRAFLRIVQLAPFRAGRPGKSGIREVGERNIETGKRATVAHGRRP